MCFKKRCWDITSKKPITKVQLKQQSKGLFSVVGVTKLVYRHLKARYMYTISKYAQIHRRVSFEFYVPNETCDVCDKLIPK